MEYQCIWYNSETYSFNKRFDVGIAKCNSDDEKSWLEEKSHSIRRWAIWSKWVIGLGIEFCGMTPMLLSLVSNTPLDVVEMQSHFADLLKKQNEIAVRRRRMHVSVKCPEHEESEVTGNVQHVFFCRPFRMRKLSPAFLF